MTTLLGGPAAGSLLVEDEPFEFESIGDSELSDRYAALRSRLTRLEAEAARVLAEIDRRRSFEPDYFTAEAFLQSRVGDSGRVARRNVAEARGLSEYSVVREAFAGAEIDRPRVAMLLAASRVSPAHFKRDEAMLVETASSQSMAGTHQAIEYWKQQVDREAAAADREHLYRRRHLHVSPALGGMIRVDGELDPVGGNTVLLALRSLADPSNLQAGDPRTPGQRRADALIELCADHLSHGEVSETGGSRANMVVTVSLDVLQGRAVGPCELEDGTVISAETARRIACDAGVSRVLTQGESEILDVGRTTRVVPAAMRRALALRDKGCTQAGCTRPHHWCDAHHVVHWADGGETALHNLVLLCRRHHRLVHEGREPPRE
jgi:hypothetical protein